MQLPNSRLGSCNIEAIFSNKNATSYGVLGPNHQPLANTKSLITTNKNTKESRKETSAPRVPHLPPPIRRRSDCKFAEAHCNPPHVFPALSGSPRARIDHSVVSFSILQVNLNPKKLMTCEVGDAKNMQTPRETPDSLLSC